MNRFEEALCRWNFKKIAKIYLIVLLIAAAACASAAGYVYRDRIRFALAYSRASETAEKGDAAALQSALEKLANSSSDVADILMLDDANRVTWSAKNSVFAEGIFRLSRAEGDDYLTCDGCGGAVFKYVKSDEFMIASVFNTDFGKLRDEYRDESFFEDGFGAKTVYMLSFLGGRDTGNKIYIISVPTSVAGGALTLKLVAAAAVLLFMVYWVLLALWAVQNAAKARLYPLLWGVVVLLANLAGVLVYQLYKRANATCPSCGASQSRTHRYCTGCGAKLGADCPSCGSPVGKKDRFCPSCGAKLE